MMVKCINDKGPYYNSKHHRIAQCKDECCILHITIGKVYKSNTLDFLGNRVSDMYYNITDDIGETHNYYKRDFIDLSKFREDKLNELGI